MGSAASAQAQMQDISQFVWNKSEELNLSTGFTSIEKMIGDQPRAMPLSRKLNFYRKKVQVLRRQAHHLSSRCASQNETRAHYFGASQKETRDHHHSRDAIETCADFPQQNYLRDLQPHCWPVTCTSSAMDASRPPVLWY